MNVSTKETLKINKNMQPDQNQSTGTTRFFLLGSCLGMSRALQSAAQGETKTLRPSRHIDVNVSTKETPKVNKNMQPGQNQSTGKTRFFFWVAAWVCPGVAPFSQLHKRRHYGHFAIEVMIITKQAPNKQKRATRPESIYKYNKR